jgi:hypothetical protein
LSRAPYALIVAVIRAIRATPGLPGGKSRLARRDLLAEHAAVSAGRELGGEPVGPPLVVGHDASPRGPR